MPDANAIQAVRDGDKERYTELVERYQRMVYAIAWSRLGDADLCEDAAQETFVKAYRYLMALRNPEKFPGWLARIAQNVSTSILRKRRRELDKRERWKLEPHTGQAVLPEEANGTPIAETLRSTLAELPVQHRECLVLYYLEGGHSTVRLRIRQGTRRAERDGMNRNFHGVVSGSLDIEGPPHRSVRLDTDSRNAPRTIGRARSFAANARDRTIA